MIEPKLLKGFRDYTPETMIPKKEIIRRLEKIFESFGFSPIDTPALEYSEILLGKAGGETEKQVYRFNDHGGRDVSLRFDLTVPLARFVALHYNELSFPFKRYHIAPVWRGENTQKGRFREFFQCDFDILGTDSIESDIEILLVIYEGMKAINAGGFRINVNNRKILNALLKKLDLSDKQVEILRSIDKIYKIGYENVINELSAGGIEVKKAENILSMLNLKPEKDKIVSEITNENIFTFLETLKSSIEDDENINRLFEIFLTLKNAGILNHFSFNPAITRGLDYYTGIVFETFINDENNFGSVCSGGRYDNLVSLYSKNTVQGVGAAFGLDRIVSLMENKNLFEKKQSVTKLLIFNLEPEILSEYLKLAATFRSFSINTEVFLEEKKIANQFKYAEKKNIPFVLFAGRDEFNKNKFNIKNIKNGTETISLSIEDIVKIIK